MYTSLRIVLCSSEWNVSVCCCFYYYYCRCTKFYSHTSIISWREITFREFLSSSTWTRNRIRFAADKLKLSRASGPSVNREHVTVLKSWLFFSIFPETQWGRSWIWDYNIVSPARNMCLAHRECPQNICWAALNAFSLDMMQSDMFRGVALMSVLLCTHPVLE